MDAVRELLQSIPKAQLSIASMVINASRRVLRCIVISAREGHRASRASGYHAATEASSKSAIGSSSIRGSISNETISSNHASCHESGPRFLKSDRAVVMSGCDRATRAICGAYRQDDRDLYQSGVCGCFARYS
jgi:hypothetical protein